MMGGVDRDALGLGVLMATAGITHLTAPALYDRMVPRLLPGAARTWTYGSGVAELAVAAALAWPRTRRAGGLASAALLVAVFPSDVKLATNWRHRPTWQRAIAYGRLPLQAPLIWWGLRVARRQDGQRPKALGGLRSWAARTTAVSAGRCRNMDGRGSRLVGWQSRIPPHRRSPGW
jgi:uncharacterized membrane protein